MPTLSELINSQPLFKDRNALEPHFNRGAIPRQEDYFGLIHTAISRKDDGIFKSAEHPLCIQSDPQKDVLHFYDYQNNGSGEPSWKIGIDNGLSIGNETGNKLTIKGSGNVGIGTDDPQALLHVDGKTRIGSAQGHLMVGNQFSAHISGSSGGNAVFGTNLKIDGNVFKTVGTHENKFGYAAMYAGWGKLSFYTRSINTSADTALNPLLRMHINSDGKVGIGTDSPDTQLHVKGPLTIEHKSNYERAYIVMRGVANTAVAKAMLNKLDKHQLIIGGAWDEHVYFYWKDEDGKKLYGTIRGRPIT